jgi:hypothetical protein
MLTQARIITGIGLALSLCIIGINLGPYSAEILIHRFSRVSYIDDMAKAGGYGANTLMYLAFGIVAVYWNFQTLMRANRLTSRRLVILSLLDIPAIPIGILMMIWKHNSWTHSPDLTSVYNPMALAIPLLVKGAVLAFVYKKPAVT